MAAGEHPQASPADASCGASVLDMQMAVLDLLRQLFLSGPSEEFAALATSLDPAELDGDDLAALRGMVCALADGQAGSAGFGERLRDEFTRLFEGPGQMPAVPFASFYLSRSKALMTSETLSVRGSYLEAGVAVEALNRMPDDFLGVELEFLYFLTREALVSADAGDEASADRRLDQRRHFVANHFAQWVPLLADALDEATQEAAFLHLAGLLRALPSALADGPSGKE